jgi:hypothetical protein
MPGPLTGYRIIDVTQMISVAERAVPLDRIREGFRKGAWCQTEVLLRGARSEPFMLTQQHHR